MIKILSNKKNNVTILYDNIIIKYTNLALFTKLKNLKSNINNDILLHYYNFKNIENKYILYYERGDNDTKRKNYFKNNIIWYIDFIIPSLLQLNCYNINRDFNWLYWYIHSDPSVDNYVFKNKKIILIDLESIEYDILILQPLFLFTKCLLDIKKENKILIFKVFFKIFILFLKKSDLYFNEFKKIWFDNIINIYIDKMSKYNFNEYLLSKTFLLNNKIQLKIFFKKYWIN